MRIGINLMASSQTKGGGMSLKEMKYVLYELTESDSLKSSNFMSMSIADAMSSVTLNDEYLQ